MSGSGSPSFVPSPRPARMTYQFVDAPLLFGSPYAGDTQAMATFGGRWFIEMTWQSFDRADLAPIGAKLNSFGRGTPFTTYLVDRERPVSLSPPTDADFDTLLVDGGSQVGTSLLVKTTGVGTRAGFLSAGDVVGFQDPGGNYQMFELVSNLDIASNAGTMTLAQPIRRPPANNAQIFSRFVPVQVILVETPRITVTPPLIYELTARMRENVVTT